MNVTTFDDWAKANTGAWRDLDGAYGAQCWDLYAAYCTEVLGAPGVGATNTSPTAQYAGYAGSLWTGYPTSTWQGQAFTRIPAGNAARKGDVAIWGRDSAHPDTHVAIVLQDAAPGARITVLAQNAWHTQNARIMTDTPASLGYLRPTNQQPIQGETDMPVKTDPINWDGDNVTVEYALQDLKHRLDSLGQRLGPVKGYQFDYLPAIFNNLNSLFGLVGKIDGQGISDDQLAKLADSLKTNLGAQVAAELAKRLAD